MNELDFALDVKAIGEDGEIEGLAVGYGNMDHGGDIVLPGAITASVAGRKSLPMLLFHDHKRPVGVWTEFKEIGEGLLVKGRFDDTQDGREAKVRARNGSLGGLSMGFKTIKHRFEGKARHLLEVALHEISLVTIPMNDRTRVLSVKDILDSGGVPTVRQFENFLRDAGGFSKSTAAQFASACKPHLRGEPEAKANDDLREFLNGLRG
ncbi:HK97 family phage prohead protease [Novosphingobium sp. TCA1]|uniref:HK97 family phage prohead protease n=1 Tax=Novosphingobium pentaromativorans TaxID=205844 RepID=A0A2W5NML0_9SPHN|nr:HK97 family phage prohead protease [Novosphingobium sp. TCA1]MBO9724319.1 HK97 family phage prohead protease [Novosphingobium sp.]PZQ54184.1 MAG: HK97 family phage prohead protease [Novosphingobium pentaromativorans]GFE73457.1 peptidase U35 [Novosphingobium sp. TCA1]